MEREWERISSYFPFSPCCHFSHPPFSPLCPLQTNKQRDVYEPGAVGPIIHLTIASRRGVTPTHRLLLGAEAIQARQAKLSQTGAAVTRPSCRLSRLIWLPSVSAVWVESHEQHAEPCRFFFLSSIISNVFRSEHWVRSSSVFAFLRSEQLLTLHIISICILLVKNTQSAGHLTCKTPTHSASHLVPVLTTCWALSSFSVVWQFSLLINAVSISSIAPLMPSCRLCWLMWW